MWQASASQHALKARAECYARIRAFFDRKNVLEVETPILGRSTASDPFLDSIKIDQPGVLGVLEKSAAVYLHTSPEYPMKRLLAAGSGDIYQICKTFRPGEAGQRHNPEFSMLEWYRLDYDLDDLQREVFELLECVLDQTLAIESLRYRDAFKRYLDIDPFEVSDVALKRLVTERCACTADDLERDDCLGLLLAQHVEPHLGKGKATFLYDYPATQASLAQVKLDDQGTLVAARFELYLEGLECANAYQELLDPKEQLRRFQEDNSKRKQLARPVIPIDQHLISALEHGLPACSGIALGLDRLLMIKTGATAIDQVLAFPAARV